MGLLRCYMPGCKNKGKYGFHKFPRDSDTCMKWQSVAKRRNLDTCSLPYSHYRICQKHFTEQDFLKSCNSTGRLKKCAVPSVLVPQESSVYDEHSYVNLSIVQEAVRKYYKLFSVFIQHCKLLDFKEQQENSQINNNDGNAQNISKSDFSNTFRIHSIDENRPSVSANTE